MISAYDDRLDTYEQRKHFGKKTRVMTILKDKG